MSHAGAHRYAAAVAAAKVRLDQLLAQRGLYPSRSRAAASVMAGEVRLGGEVADKPGRLVAENVEVAYGELAWELRTDDRVTVLERCNARALAPGDLPYRPELIVIDVSFISLLKVLPAALRCAADRFDCLAMVKPQFEAGRDK